MAWLITGLIVVLIGTALLVLGRRDQVTDSDGVSYSVRWMRPTGLGVMILGFLFTLPGFVYTQDPGEVVLKRGATGDILGVDTSAGIGFKAPWTRLVGFDVRNQKIEMFSNAGGEGEQGAAINAPLENGSNVSVSITTLYSVDPTEEAITEIYRRYRTQDNFLNLKLRPDVRDEVRRATAQFNAFEVKQNRAAIADDVTQELAESWDELGVTVDDVNLGDLGLDQETEDALKRVNERQAEAEASRADLERAQIDAEKTKTEALAEQAADQIVRCGATVTTETRVVAGQETEVQVVTPVPVERCQNLLNEQVLTARYIQALERMAEKGNLIVLPQGADVSSLLNVERPQPPQ